MLLHNFADADIRNGDTITNPRFEEGGALQVFDRILANPPFSLKEWHGIEADSGTGNVDLKQVKARYENDPYRRFRRGVPPTTKGDTAFLQHMVEVCNDRAMVGVIMPNGVLFRGGAEADIRKALLEEDLFDAVIGLPEKLFYGTGIPAAILILNKAKPQQRKGKVLFIDASPEGFYHEGKNRNSLRLQDILRIVAVFDAYAQAEQVPSCIDHLAGQWKAAVGMHRQRQLKRVPSDELRDQVNAKFDDQAKEIEQARKAVHYWFNAEHPGGRTSLEKFAAVVTLEEIAKENDYNLNISRYVDSSDPTPQLDVKEELKKLRELEARRNAAEQKMNKLLEEFGYAV